MPIDPGLPAVDSSSNFAKHYESLHAGAGQVLFRTLASNESRRLSTLHAFAEDVSTWQEVLGKRPENVLYSAALCEYQFALFAVATGQYRQAFMSLRLFLELHCFGIECSANEFWLRRWIRGERDLVWANIIDEQTGIFSTNFARAFNDDLQPHATQYGAIARRTYRQCSEFVHANHVTISGLKKLEFNGDVLTKWLNEAESIKLVISFLLCLRYLAVLDPEDRPKLEMVVMDSVGHISEIRQLIGGPTEARNG